MASGYIIKAINEDYNIRYMVCIFTFSCNLKMKKNKQSIIDVPPDISIYTSIPISYLPVRNFSNFLIFPVSKITIDVPATAKGLL